MRQPGLRLHLPRVPVLLPSGTYLVSDTLNLTQKNPGGSDGINVVPGRFLPHALIGRPVVGTRGGARPVLKLAPHSPGFSNATLAAGARTHGRGHERADSAGPLSGRPLYTAFKPVLNLGQSNVNMNQLLKGIDVDLTAAGNPGACGVFHNGAQGSTVTDVTVTAGDDAYACFCGLNGAGGMHSNVKGHGGRFGVVTHGAQPVPSAVGLVLTGQSVSAVVFGGGETLSLVGVTIEVPPHATGPAIRAVARLGMSLVDVAITCTGAPAANQTAIATGSTLYARDLYVKGCSTAVSQAGSAGIAGPPPGQHLHVSVYAKGGPTHNTFYNTDVVYAHGARLPGGVVAHMAHTVQPPPPDRLTQHIWNESAFADLGGPSVADAKRDCGAKGDRVTDDTVALQMCLGKHGSVFLPPGMYRISATLDVSPGGSLVGMNNAASVLLAASSGFPGASAAAPRPMVRTATDAGAGAAPTTIAFLGIVTWQHLANVYTLDWRTQHPLSLWRTNFESRNCECLWLSAYVPSVAEHCVAR